MTLGDAAVQRFLSTKEIVLLATVQPDGAPLAMPMWFLHDPDGLTMISVGHTAKVRNLRRDPRVWSKAVGAPRCGTGRPEPACRAGTARRQRFRYVGHANDRGAGR